MLIFKIVLALIFVLFVSFVSIYIACVIVEHKINSKKLNGEFTQEEATGYLNFLEEQIILITDRHNLIVAYFKILALLIRFAIEYR